MFRLIAEYMSRLAKAYSYKGRHYSSTIVDDKWIVAVKLMAQRRQLNAQYGIGG